MARRLGSVPSPVPQPGDRSTQLKDSADETAIRAYLRALIGSPVRSADLMQTTQAPFVDAVGNWTERTGVDRRTLVRIGVDPKVLDLAGLKATPVSDIVRRHYQSEPLSVADLARRSGVSSASVRQTVYDDVSNGLVAAIDGPGKTVLYRRFG